MDKINILIITIFFMLSFVSAFEFDDTLRYENDDIKVTIVNNNFLKLGDLFGYAEDLGSIELKSHKTVQEVKKFHYGKEEVTMYYDFRDWEFQKDGLGEVTFTDIKTGKEIEKDYHFVEWVIAPVTRYVYGNVTIWKTINGSNIYELQIINTYEEDEWQWKRLDTKDIPNRNTRIGLKTYIEKGDKMDGVWTIAGKKISKHAGWQADWNTGLQNYFKFEETSGAVAVDSVNNNNGTIQGTLVLGVDGQILNGFQSIAGDNDWVEVPTTALSEFTINLWLKSNGSVDEWAGGWTGDLAGVFKVAMRRQAATGNVRFQVSGGGSITTTGIDIISGGWHMLTGVYNTTHLLFYYNGTLNATALQSGVIPIDNYELFRSENAADRNWGGEHDEIGFWLNDSLTAIEISDIFDAQVNGFENGSYNDIIENTTTYTTHCSSSNINWTDLPDGAYSYNVTTCNVNGYCNNTGTRIVNIDTTTPIIEYAPNSDATNITGNFTTKDFVFINVTVTEINENDITFIIYTSNGTYSEDNFVNSTRIMNYTNLPEGMYFWNVTVCDMADNCDTTGIRNYGVEKTNVSLELNFSNIDAELGGNILVNASNNLGIICVDVDHPDYGVNYSCDTFSLGFDLVINYFRKTVFNDSSTSIVLNFIGEQIKTVFFEAHQYDEVAGLSINITGTNTTSYPYNVQINNTNTTQIDRIFPGFLVGDNIYLNQFNDGQENESLFYTGFGSKIIYMFMDENSTFKEFVFNISGELFGFDYFDYFNDTSVLDPIINEGFFRGGFALPKGEDLRSFIYDTFSPDGNINSTLWIKTPDGTYPSGGNGYDFIVSNAYSGNKMVLTTSMDEDFVGSGSRISSNQAYTNFTQLNLWTTQEVDVDVSFSNSVDKIKSSGRCNITLSGSLDGVTFWESAWQTCSRTGVVDCIAESETLENLSFNLVRNVNNSWNVSISGTERAFGNGFDGGDCGAYSFVYNYTSGTLTKTVDTPGGACSQATSPLISSLDNTSIINNLNWATLTPVKFKATMDGTFVASPSAGCDNMRSTFNVFNMNRSIYNLSNSSIISTSVFDSTGDITKATLGGTASVSPGDNIFSFLSVDDGANWESVNNLVEHTFSSTGKSMRYRFDFVLSNGGYMNYAPFLDDMNITTPQGFPANLTFDFGNDGVIDATYDGELNTTNSPATITISSAIIPNLPSSSSTFPHLIEVPLEIVSLTTGQLDIDTLNFTYNPNPVLLNHTSVFDYIINFINFLGVPISIESVGGNITVNDLRYDYAGGNDTIEVMAHNVDYSQNLTRNVTYYYSRWDYEWVPHNVEWLYFSPSNYSDKNVQPYGQAAVQNKSIMNITNYGYGGRNATLSLYVNDSLECRNTTVSLDNNKSNGFRVNESWINLTEYGYLETIDIYMWADYDCNYSTWTILEPYFYFRPCVNGGVCSTDLI